jgi:hypothetical protein
MPASSSRFDSRPTENTERRFVLIAMPAPTWPMTMPVCVIVVAWM